jgi:peroxiredoxin
MQLVELQQNLETLQANGIRPFAISPNPPDVLRRFADKFAIS